MTTAVIFHKNPISARLRVLRFTNGGLFGPVRPQNISNLGQAVDTSPAPHPAAVVAELEALLSLDAEYLKPMAQPLLWLGELPVFGVECTTHEPSEALADAANADWIDFTAVRTLPLRDQDAARVLYTRMVG